MLKRSRLRRRALAAPSGSGPCGNRVPAVSAAPRGPLSGFPHSRSRWSLARPRLKRWGLGIGLACAIFAALAWGIFQPWAANHFGYALPGQDHLPYRISYAGRDYGNPYECAGDSWCQPTAKTCMSQEELRESDLWPLRQVGSIPTLFGAAYPLLAPPGSGGQLLTYLLVFDGDDCYLTYGLMGGP